MSITNILLFVCVMLCFTILLILVEKEFDVRRIKRSDAYKLVLSELKQYNTFCGEYNAESGNEKYMYGIQSVMKAVAKGAGDKFAEKFTREFTENMRKSEERANGNAVRKNTTANALQNVLEKEQNDEPKEPSACGGIWRMP